MQTQDTNTDEDLK